MSYKRFLEASTAGPVQLVLRGHNASIEVRMDPRVWRVTVQAYTDGGSQETIRVIDELALREHGGTVGLTLPKAAEADGGQGSVIASVGGIVIGNNTTMIQSFGGGGYSSVYANGQHIETRNGRTYINGADVTDTIAKTNAAGGGPRSQVHLRAIVPPGSSLQATTYNGIITVAGLDEVDLETYNGHLTVTDLVRDSQLKTYNGHIKAGARSGHRPTVQAATYNGNITALDDDIRLRPQTRNGRIIYPS